MAQRIDWIDRARGYGLFLVVAGHLGIPFIGKYLTAFHMPLFFLLSGLVFSIRKDGFYSFVIKKAKRLIVPWAFLSIPIFAASVISRINGGVKDIWEYVNLIPKFIFHIRTSPLWFLTALFFIYIIFYWIVKLFKNNYLLCGIVSCVAGIVAVIYYKLGGISLVWNIDVSIAALPFFYLGYLMRSFYDKVECCKLLNSFWMFAVSAVSYIGTVTLNIYLSGQVLNFATNEYGIYPLSFLSAIFGIYCTYYISLELKIKLMSYFGRNTWVYFAWHQQIVIPLLLWLFGIIGIFRADTLLSDAIRIVTIFILIFVSLFPFDRLLHIKKLRFLLGEDNSH